MKSPLCHMTRNNTFFHSDLNSNGFTIWELISLYWCSLLLSIMKLPANSYLLWLLLWCLRTSSKEAEMLHCELTCHALWSDCPSVQYPGQAEPPLYMSHTYFPNVITKCFTVFGIVRIVRSFQNSSFKIVMVLPWMQYHHSLDLSVSGWALSSTKQSWRIF